MKRALVSFVLLCAAFAQAFAQSTGVPYFPQTLPGSTVVGRLSANPGATEAIPLTTLSRSLGLLIQPQNVKTAGAKCDGTTDDTAVIQALIDRTGTVATSIHAYPAVIDFGSTGICKVSTLVVRQSNVKLIGTGAKILGSAASPVLSFTYAGANNNWGGSVEGLYIDCAGVGTAGIKLTTAHGLSITNNYISGCTVGIDGLASFSNSIIGNRVVKSGTIGIRAGIDATPQGSINWRILSNTVYGTDPFNAGYVSTMTQGIYLNYGSGHYIAANDIESATTNGILVDTSYNNIIRDNYLEVNGAADIVVSNQGSPVIAQSSDWNLIAGNIFSGQNNPVNITISNGTSNAVRDNSIGYDATIGASATGTIWGVQRRLVHTLTNSGSGTVFEYGFTPFAVGDLLYASASTTLSKLAGVATGNALISGGITTAPSWGKVGLTTHVSGILPVANGGVGATLAGTGGSNQVLQQTSSGGVITVGQLAFSNLSGAVATTQYGTPATYTVQLLYTASAVNFNSTNTDTAITITLPTGYTRYRVSTVFIHGASASISTATFGLFTATGGGGTAILTGQTITVTTAAEGTNNNMQSTGTTNASTQSFNNVTLYFRVQTAQGSAATGSVGISILPLS